MISRLRTTLKNFRWIIIGSAVMSGLLFAAAIERQASVTAAPPPPGVAPKVISVNVSTSSTSATIQFSTDYAAHTRIAYGTTTSYGSFEPIGGGYVDPGPGDDSDHILILSNLPPSTTYHFRIDTQAPGSGETGSTPDRSFTTGSGESGTGAFTINPQGVECVGGRCRVNFSTTLAANVQIKWDLSSHGLFDDYTLGSTGEPAGSFLVPTRSLDIPQSGFPDLALGTTHHFRMRGTDSSGNVTTTNDLTFTTGQDSDDRTFSTGACSDGTPIGSCSASGAICEAGGNLVFRCDSLCGFTCPGGQSCSSNGQCVSDPPLTGSPFQCNPGACYNDAGDLINPSPPGEICYRSWSRCTANTVLKVRKDRACNLWLSCNTALQTEPELGQPGENLCLSLAACNGLGPDGQCNRFLPSGQCTNDPLRFCNTSTECEAGGTCAVFSSSVIGSSLRDVQYETPDQIGRIANLSGNVIAGLDWNVGTLANISNAGTTRGFLPWQLMRQIGGKPEIINGDLEYDPPSVDPWEAVPAGFPKEAVLTTEFENRSNSHNHILKVDALSTIAGLCSDNFAQSCTDDSECGGTCGIAVQFSGAATKSFDALPTESYYAEARIRSQQSATVRMQFGHNDYRDFSVTNPDGSLSNTYIDVPLTAAWQRVTLGPIEGMGGDTRLAFVLAPGQSNATFEVDDVQVRPVLQANTDPTFITPSCRLYPKEDSPSCDYVDQNGIQFSGWRGYCLEHDSVTGTCLSWWPVDLIKGESDIFGSEQTAGYADRTPLFICAESAGVYNSPDPLLGITTFGSGGPSGSQSTCDAGAAGNGGVNICGLPLKHYQVMTTPLYQDLSGFDGDAQCGELENFGPCRSNWTRGICACADPGPDEVFTLGSAASATDRLINKNDIEFFRLVTFRRNPRWQTIGFPTQLILGPNNELPDGRWHLPWSNPAAGDSFNFYITWDANGFLQRYDMNMGVGTADSNDEGGAIMVGMFAMREQCTKVVQVVKPSSPAQTFATRVSSNAYQVPNLNYSKNQDLSPYGGALQPQTSGTIRSDNPVTWPSPLYVESPDTLDLNGQNLQAPYQARAGAPYACKGNCNRVCSTLAPNGTPVACSSDLDCNGLTIYNGVVTPANYSLATNLAVKGRCIGTVPSAGGHSDQLFGTHDPTFVNEDEYFAQERIRRLFVKSQGLWGWNGSAYAQIAQSWEPPDTICPIDATTLRPRRAGNPLADYPNDYCAVPPSISNAKFLNSPAGITTVTGGGGTVAITFNSNADPDQVPLKGFKIAWGDSVDPISFPYAPRNDASRPHIVSHVYRTPGNQACGDGSFNCHQIRIQAEDNWNWCNDAVGTTKCQPDTDTTQWIDTGLRVRVEP